MGLAPSIFAALLPLIGSAMVQAQSANGVEAAMARRIGLPAVLVENRGQWSAECQMVATGTAPRLILGSRGVSYVTGARDPDRQGQSVRVDLVLGGAEDLAWQGAQPAPGLHSFFVGAESSHWQAGIPGHRAAVAESPSGWRVRATPRTSGLDLEFTIAAANGAPAVTLESDGPPRFSEPDLHSADVDTAAGRLSISKLTARTVLATGEARALPVSLQRSGSRLSFVLPDRDESLPFTISIGLTWSGFLGGSGGEMTQAMAVSSAGEVVAAGKTYSPDFPVTPDAFDTSYAGGQPTFKWDAFVAKFTADGSNLVFATYLGGANKNEGVAGVAATASGDVIVVGQTFSPDFPTTPGAWGNTGDVFVTRLTADGTALVYSTRFGGSLICDPKSAMLDPEERITVVGTCTCADYPATPGAYKTIGEGYEAFIARFSADGSSLEASTLLGGTSTDSPDAGALAPSGAVLVVGEGASSFPTTPGAYQHGPGDLWVARLDPTLTRLEASTFVSWNTGARPTGVAADPSGAVTVVGTVSLPGFPVTPGAYDTTISGLQDGFVLRLSEDMSEILWSTFLGGGRIDECHGVSVDSAGAVTVAGNTDSLNFPTTPGALQPAKASQDPTELDLFAAKLSPDGSSLWYATYLGGAGFSESGQVDDMTMAGDGIGGVLVGSHSASAGYPVTPGAFQTEQTPSGSATVSWLTLLPNGVGRYGASSPGCAGPIFLGVTAQPRVGLPFGLTCTNGPPSANGYFFFGLAPLDPPAMGKGVSLWVDPLLLFPVSSNAAGFTQLPLFVPPDPLFAGVTIYAQFAWSGDACAAPAWVASNALAITIQP